MKQQDKKNKTYNKLLLVEAPIKNVLELRKKTESQIIVEKFLEKSYRKTITILKVCKRHQDSLQNKLRNRMHCRLAMAILPVAFLLAHLLPLPMIEVIVGDEGMCRLLVAFGFFSSSMCFLSISFGFFVSLLVSSIVGFFFGFFTPPAFFELLFSSPIKKQYFVYLALSCGCYPIARILIYLFTLPAKLLIQVGKRIKKSDHVQLKKDLQNALNEAPKITFTQIEELIKEYAPSMLPSLSNLTFNDMTFDLHDTQPVVHEAPTQEEEKEPLPKAQAQEEAPPQAEEPSQPQDAQENEASQEVEQEEEQEEEIYPLEKWEDIQDKAICPLKVGTTPQGTDTGVDLVSLPHLLVGGKTESGKSNFMFNVLDAILGLEKPKQIFLIDAKGTDFWNYQDNPNIKIYPSLEDLEKVLDSLLAEIERRKKLFSLDEAKNFSEYREEGLPRVFLFIDEYYTLQHDCVDKKLVQQNQLRLASFTGMCRAFGMHVILGTQRPDAKIVHNNLLQSFSACMAFKAGNQTNAQILKAPQAHRIRREQKGLGYWAESDLTILVQTPLANQPKRKPKGTPVPKAPTLVPKGTTPVPKAPTPVPKAPTLVPKGTTPVPKSTTPVPKGTTLEDQPIYRPAKKNEEDASFFPYYTLYKILKNHPSQMGFKKTRLNKNGKRIWGYWAKERVS